MPFMSKLRNFKEKRANEEMRKKLHMLLEREPNIRLMPTIEKINLLVLLESELNKNYIKNDAKLNNARLLKENLINYLMIEIYVNPEKIDKITSHLFHELSKVGHLISQLKDLDNVSEKIENRGISVISSDESVASVDDAGAHSKLGPTSY